MPTRAAKAMKSTLQYLDRHTLVHETKDGIQLTYFSPICKSPAPFLRIMQCLEQITKTTPETA